MLTYTTAPTVAADDVITSAQWNQFCAAVNDRLRGGAADPTWRMHYKAYSVFRDVRTSDFSTFPAKDEWLSTYMHADPSVSLPDWTPENDLNPLLSFVWGSATYSQDDESRIALAVVSSLPASVYDLWQLGKSQRGAIDLATGDEGSPSLAAARSHLATVYANQMALYGSAGWTPFLRKYGGTLPVLAPSLTPCNAAPVTDPDTEELVAGAEQTNYVVRFRNISGGSDWTRNAICEYTGLSPNGDDAVKTIKVADESYLVTTWADITYELKFADYIFEPGVESAGLRHTDALPFKEFMQRFASDFRGTSAERADDGYHLRSVAFDFQRFLTTQHLLAPAYGIGSPEIEANYPVYNDLTAEAGDYLTCLNPTGGGSDWNPGGLTGYVVAGVLVRVEAGVGSVRLQIIDPDATEPVLETFSGSDGDHMIWFDAPKPLSYLKIKTLTAFTSVDTGIYVEVAILEQRLPTLQDAYVLLRNGTTLGAEPDALGSSASAKQLESDYFQSGCIVNTESVASPTEPAENPVYETARQMIRDRMRLVKRPSFKGYAVEDGKTVLWFDRMLPGDLDAFEGIAPPLAAITSGNIVGGIQYRAVGSIDYNGDTYTDEEFTGVDGVKDFEAASEGAEVFQVEGIIATAPLRGLSNQWLMFQTSNCYNDSEGSDWKPDSYGDVLAFLHNRCHFLSVGMFDVTELCNHAVNPAAVPCAPPPLVQSPSAHNYYDRLNENIGFSEDDRTSFFKSCQLYPKDYEIESATYDSGTGEVKLVFTTRFSTTLGAGDIARASGPDSCSAEEYRTDENTLRQYLYYAASSGDCAPLIGDAAEIQNPTSAGPGANGSCHPRFYFTRLLPTVHEDSNTITEPLIDTRCLAHEAQWAVWILDAICEGYVDSTRTGSYEECPSGRAVNYTMRNLCVDIGAPHFVSFMPDADRADRPSGCGPFANTYMRAGLFNRIGAAFNLLTRVPVELPFEVEKQTHHFSGLIPADLGIDYGTDPDSCGTAADHMYSGRVLGSHGAIGEGDIAETGTDSWAAATGVSAQMASRIDYDSTIGPSADFGFTVQCDDGNTQFNITIEGTADRLRFKTTQNYMHAIPDHLSGNMESELRLMVSIHEVETPLANVYPSGTEPTWGPGSPAAFHWNDGAGSTNVGTEIVNGVDTFRCYQLRINDGAEFDVLDILKEPGYVAPASLYWAALETSGPGGGTDRYNNYGGSFRSVNLSLAPNVVGTLTMPLV